MKTSEVFYQSDEVPGVHVAICIPSHDMIPASFAYDLARLCILTAGQFIAPGSISKLSIHQASGSVIHRARQELADAVLEFDADYSFWLDGDMRFPKETLINLLVRHDELHPLEGHVWPIVATNYCARSYPPRAVATKRLPTAKDPGERLLTDDAATGMEEVESAGFGCVLVHTNVLKKMRDQAERPWFRFGYDHEIDQHVGEDTYFFRLAAELGFPTVVDHDVSKSLRHTGQFEYTLGHVLDFQEGLTDGDGDDLQQPADVVGELPQSE